MHLVFSRGQGCYDIYSFYSLDLFFDWGLATQYSKFARPIFDHALKTSVCLHPPIQSHGRWPAPLPLLSALAGAAEKS